MVGFFLPDLFPLCFCKKRGEKGSLNVMNLKPSCYPLVLTFLSATKIMKLLQAT